MKFRWTSKWHWLSYRQRTFSWNGKNGWLQISLMGMRNWSIYITLNDGSLNGITNTDCTGIGYNQREAEAKAQRVLRKYLNENF